jgi:hypothetical protein
MALCSFMVLHAVYGIHMSAIVCGARLLLLKSWGGPLFCITQHPLPACLTVQERPDQPVWRQISNHHSKHIDVQSGAYRPCKKWL